MGPFEQVVAALNSRGVRFIVIGVSGANYYATSGSSLFVTADRDLYIPPDCANALAAWAACESVGLVLWSGREPLHQPRDLTLAEAIVARQALVRASEGVEIPVARLRHIVESKAAAGRPKDRLFLATHQEALRELLGRE